MELQLVTQSELLVSTRKAERKQGGAFSSLNSNVLLFIAGGEQGYPT